MADKPLQLINGLPTGVEAKVTSAGAADAGKIPALDAGGKFDASLLPAGIGATALSVPTSENLVAGDHVNLYDVAGTLTMRLANASTASAARRAHGYVSANSTSPAANTIYFEGINSNVATTLVPGTEYYLSHTTPGGVVDAAGLSTTAGHLAQYLGVATGVNALQFVRALPIVRG